MRCNFHKLLAVSLTLQLLGLLSPPVSADQVNVPHDFTAGTTAKASEVNANFSAIETAVNDNDSRISTNANQITSVADAHTTMLSRLNPIVLDANDNVIGLLLTIFGIDGVSVITARGYRFNLSESQGPTAQIVGLSYPSDNCTGTPFSPKRAGVVFRAYDLSGVIGLHYVSKDSIATAALTFRSSTSPGGCAVLPDPLPQFFSWPALLNDPEVTGVSTLSFPLPLKIK